MDGVNDGVDAHPRAPKLHHESDSLASNGTIDILTSSQQVSKRKADAAEDEDEDSSRSDKRRKGTAPIKEEYLILKSNEIVEPRRAKDEADDDAAEAFHHQDREPEGRGGKKGRKKNTGQNKNRNFGTSRDEVGLCSSRTSCSEFSPESCSFGERCRFEHDIRKYLQHHKRADLDTFGGLCPVWDVKGKCNSGWKCRFVGSHSTEIKHEGGREELVLVEKPDQAATAETTSASDGDANEVEVVNGISNQDRIALTKKKFPTPKADVYLPWLEANQGRPNEQGRFQKVPDQAAGRTGDRNSSSPEPDSGKKQNGPKTQDGRAEFVDSPLLPSEKRRLYFGPETPVLAPLTTQGNLPFRRLCASLGATFTYSEMAMSLPLLSGQKSEWALLKAHESEIQPPTFTSRTNIVYDYDRSTDLQFGAQIAANKPWLAVKTTEVIGALLPKGLRVVDLNCGCPIDLVYREGAGSALMDSPNKLDKILRGMNAVSGEIPITVKIRTGTKDRQPTAQKLVDRLVLGAQNQGDGARQNPCGVAAVTLHGRSRQQRYTRRADWEYIADTAALIKNLNAEADALADTIRETDERDQANSHGGRKNPVFFLGNGDVFSHEEYNDHIQHSGVDAVMVARGAIIKPWIFEEIAQGQYLDKSSSERLGYIEQFCRNGLEAWGSDEVGVGQTRRFLLEYLSFACRYIPVGMLEHLPPSINDRPPAYRGRDALETLMASDNFKDWIKISEMFLGPAHKDFRFEPKHKSNAHDEAEG